MKQMVCKRHSMNFRDRDVLIKYTVSGEFVDAKIDCPVEQSYPAECPEIELVSITDEDTDEVIELKTLTVEEEKHLQEVCLENIPEPDVDDEEYRPRRPGKFW